ncbi:hypothetical protein ADEAN_000609000 [Angomonas deanei]|uniref:Uncharacterized protein n=1 Tax=Angomonas deanei TaxID=59799 RepID=A0A7G2CGG9_9TRYP|nr:hypothetical protein ADEAN_000609000 [Angomonas deanei]
MDSVDHHSNVVLPVLTASSLYAPKPRRPIAVVETSTIEEASVAVEEPKEETALADVSQPAPRGKRKKIGRPYESEAVKRRYSSEIKMTPPDYFKLFPVETDHKPVKKINYADLVERLENQDATPPAMRTKESVDYSAVLGVPSHEKRKTKRHTARRLPPIQQKPSSLPFDPARPSETTPFRDVNKPLTYNTVKRVRR